MGWEYFFSTFKSISGDTFFLFVHFTRENTLENERKAEGYFILFKLKEAI
jgi:succinate dehydrogenase/fumarate reductase cytochrome b subunit